MDTMTSRERWLAAIRRQPVDRLPFWPKLDGAYARHQREPFKSMSLGALHAYMGSDPHFFGPECVKTVYHKAQVESTSLNSHRRTVYSTSGGSLTYLEHFDEESVSWHPVEFPVKRREDIAVLAEVFEDASYEFDADAYKQALWLNNAVGAHGMTACSLGISPLMDWLQYIAGIENGHYLLADYQADVEALFAAMHAALLRRIEVILAKAPYEIIYSIENTSTTIISPQMFRRYCARHLADYGRAITGAGKIHILHMCGKLKNLLPDVGELPAAGIEAFTSPPVGNTMLLDGRTLAPRMCLIGGTNATNWLYGADEIIAAIEQALGQLPDQRGVVVTSAGVMPPACAPETIKRVCDGVKAYRPAAGG